MKLTSTVLAILLVGSSVFAAMADQSEGEKTMKQKIELVKTMAYQQINKDATDFRITEPTVDKEGFCGGEGPTIYVKVQVRSVTPNDVNGDLKFTDSWTTIMEYAASSGELNGSVTTGLMNVKNCYE